MFFCGFRQRDVNIAQFSGEYINGSLIYLFRDEWLDQHSIPVDKNECILCASQDRVSERLYGGAGQLAEERVTFTDEHGVGNRDLGNSMNGRRQIYACSGPVIWR